MNRPSTGNSAPDRDDLRIRAIGVDVGPIRLVRLLQVNPWWTLALAPICISILVAACARDGSLVVKDGSWWSTVWYDVQRFFGRNDGSRSQAEFPLLRDSATFAIVVLQSLNITLIHWQWRSFEVLFSSMYEARSMRGTVMADRPHNGQPSDLSKQIRSENRFYEVLTACNFILVPLCVGAAVFLDSGLKGSSLFRQFAPEKPPSGWFTSAFDHWWASRGWGNVAFVGLSAFFSYYLILQNIVGLRMCVLLIRIRNRLAFSPGHYDHDFRGLAPVGSVLKTVYWSILVNLSSLVLLVAIVQGSRTGHLQPYLAMLVLGGLMYLAIPLLVLDTVKHNAIGDRLAEVEARKLSERDANAAIGVIRSVRVPLNYRRIGFLTLSLLPTSVAAYQLWLWIR